MKTNNIVKTAVMAALIFVFTTISFPVPPGRVNMGDAAVLVSVYLFGPLCGSISAAIGSALSDIVLGYAVYAPATFIIKILVAIVFWYVLKLLKNEKPFSLSVSSLIAEAVMVFGYFLFNILWQGNEYSPLISVVGDFIQAVASVLVFVLVSSALKKFRENP